MKNILLFGLFLSCLFLNAQISVTATAGSSTGYYTNLKSAFDAINSGNHQGYINININSNTTETTTAVLNDVSTYNAIIIKPTTTATVSGSVDSNPLIKILGSNVLIDGSVSATGNSRDLTISNISTINPSVIHMGSANSNAPLKFVTLRNTVLSNANNNGSNLVIANGESVPAAGFFSNLAITNNDFRGGSNGLFINADPTVTYIENSLQISNNIVGNNIIQNGIYVSGFKGSTSIINNNISIIRTTNGSSGLPAVSIGINIGLGTNQSTISGNTISVKNTSTYYAGYNQLTGIYVSPGASNISTQINNNTINEVSGILVTLASAGVYVTEATSNIKIFSNKISGLKNTNQGNTPISGIVLGSSSNTANTLIYNNVIYDILGYGLVNGIYIFSGGGYKIYHNTINLINTTAVNYSGPSNALHISSNVTIPNSLDIRNNFFINKLASGTRYAILCGLNSNNIFTNIDNNDYFSTGDALGFLGTYRYTLADMQAGFGGNLNSLNISPIFASPTDYHISPITNPTLDNKGVYLQEVSVDFDGAIRANPSDIGAYEFSQALSVDDIKNDKSNLNVYPNPFSSILNISDIKGLKSIIITDYSGRKIREFAPTNELSLNDIKSGGYFLVLQYENGDYKSVKIIKN